MQSNPLNRRQFIHQTGKGLIAASLAALPLSACAREDLTIQEVIDLIMDQIPGARNPTTVDTIKSGEGSWPVKGIATTFLATVPVIEKAAVAGVNLIITHEPTYYNHFDNTKWLEEDAVYQYKKALLDKHKIVVWRFHDYWHRHRPDGIVEGFLNLMNWQEYLQEEPPCVVHLPSQNLLSLANQLKSTVQLNRCFYVGDPNMEVSKVGLLLGAWGLEKHIEWLQKDIDVLVVGEVSEWETSEYVRDASAAGMKKGLIIMGHAASEEPGMEYCKEWLEALLPKVKIHHIPSGDAFQAV